MYSEPSLDRNGLIDKWTPLVHSIILKRFPYFGVTSHSLAKEKIRRSVDYDDAVQTGLIGLMEAIDNYDSQHPSAARFITFATTVIYRTVLNYIEDNMSPLKTPRLSSKTAAHSQRFIDAAGYKLFSELADHHPDVPTPGPASAAEQADFYAAALKKLESVLAPQEYDMLIGHYAGISYSTLGEIHGGLSPMKVYRQIQALKIRCLSLLFQERSVLF